jgi:tryptophan synthase alpha chain
MSRVTELLKKRGERKLLIPFFTAGFPNQQACKALISKSASAGADIIEIGIPFSDPLADGPSIQYSSQVALKNGTTLASVLDFVQTLRQRIDTPILLMGYYNPMLAFGISKFVAACSSVGVDGLIIPDLPLDEAAEIRTQLVRRNLSLIFLAAPTSSDNRLKQISRLSTDFVYAVTITGVTGSRKTFGAETDAYLRRLRNSLGKPFVAGFGVSSPDSAVQLARYADGVVIGSALIELIRLHGPQKGASEALALLARIRARLDRIGGGE